MLCELCHKNEVKGVLHRKDADGEDEELYVCENCLSQGKNANTSNLGSTSNEDAAQASADNSIDEPPAFIQNILDAAVGLIESVAKSELSEEKKCPICGFTWERIKKERKVGCADCWANFGKEIKNEFLSGSYGPKHIGKIPEKTPDGKRSRAFLEKELKIAVSRQKYRKAAQIQKMLDELNIDTMSDGIQDGKEK